MTRRIMAAWLVLACLCAGAGAQGEGIETIQLRVISRGAGATVIVDRGSNDGLAVGDIALLRPKGAATQRGTVIKIDARSAVVELFDARRIPVPGTRGEAQVPSSRFAPEPAAVEPAAPAATLPPLEEAPEHPPWENEDEEWSADQPLLAAVRAVRPEDRDLRITGRWWLRGDQILTSDGGRSDSFYRTGTSLLFDNPFGQGGQVHFDGEWIETRTLRPDEDDLARSEFRIDRLSYTLGGTRYRSERLEVGRFLQNGLPELGFLDGVEWSRRRDNGDTWGVSFGYMPEADFDFDTGEDLQVGAFYHWTVDEAERLVFSGGLQKTFHDGTHDRDLLVAKVRYLPLSGWTLNATTWVDWYDTNDDKDGGFELTQAVASVGRTLENGDGLDLTFTHLRFPDIERNEFVAPVTTPELLDNRNDRLALAGWSELGARLDLHGEVGLWDDEDDRGADAELRFELRDFLVDDTTTGLTGFASRGDFESVLGGRLNWGRQAERGRWDVYYELTNHHLDGFTDDRDDLLQHRAGVSRDWWFRGGWSFSLWSEAIYYDEEGSLAAGFSLQRSF